MRIFLKVLLFPLTLALTLLVLFLRFLCMASAVVLNILSGFVLLAALVVLQEPLRAVWQYFVLAWLLSPYGVPLFAALLVEGLDAVCGRLRAIQIPNGAALRPRFFYPSVKFTWTVIAESNLSGSASRRS